jgi:phage portal protein BeeE
MQIINSILSKSSLVKNLQKQVKALTTLSTGVTIGNYRAIYPDWQIFKEAEAYQKFDDIYSVVSFLAETAATIPLYAYSVKNDSALKHYQQKGATTLQGRYYQTKALVDLPETDLLARFLSSFTYEQRLFHSLYEFTRGETIYYLYQEDIGPNAGEIRPYMLNKDYVTLFVSEEFPQRVLKYRFDDGKNQFDIAPEDIMHTKFPNPDFNNGNNWRGLSPMKVLNKRITRIESGMNASVAQLQNGGVPGVMFMKGDGDIELMGKLQDDLAKFLSNSDNKGAPYYASGDIGYIPWGLPLADLEVAELAGIDFTKICNAFKVPEQLLNNHSASTDNNMQWAEKKAIYQQRFTFNLQAQRCN